ncbi:MAG: 4Fe-4S binding protein [Nitrospinota bacterium]|nr:4Fe-4S binding protein [Nitrospinota bacterium]
MKRNIIKIDEELCNGCGLCANGCPEGAIQMIDGKARLVGELLCDGLGACIGDCPVDAIQIETREAEPYDEVKVMGNIVAKGESTLKAHLKHLYDHKQEEYLMIAEKYMKENNIDVPDYKGGNKDMGCGCPGSMMRDMRGKGEEKAAASQTTGPLSSALRQWPTQLQLLNPMAPYFKDADILIAADCTAFAYADFHRRFIKDKTMVMFCPKLDSGLEGYIEKLTTIFKENNIKSITVVRMEVPCCNGALRIAEEALKRSGKNILMKEYVVSIDGNII